MRAVVGDRIVIKGHHIGEPDHDAETPVTRALLFPGTDAFIQHFEQHAN